jgi:hypothetical protein
MRIVNFLQPNPGDGLTYRNQVDGHYVIPRKGIVLTVIASDGEGWEHVSVSTSRRCPTWEEMEFIRGLFWRDDETVMQLSVPRASHRSLHPYCLHWWKPTDQDIPRPPDGLVGTGEP